MEIMGTQISGENTERMMLQLQAQTGWRQEEILCLCMDEMLSNLRASCQKPSCIAPQALPASH